MTQGNLCACPAQMQPHDRVANVCPPIVRVLPPAPEPRAEVHFPIGHEWRPARELLVEPDPEDGR